jgi:hypothetical protein
MNHDAAFKKLLTTFFAEFIAAFLPEVSAYLDPTTFEFLDKQVIARITADSKKREADLVVKARFRGEETFFLIHLENQSRRESGFPKRMFRYFSRLHDQYDLPVYPIALFSYNAPRTEEPSQYTLTFPDKTVLEFQYRVIQLNRLSWREFLQQPNPAATALMAKMQIAPEERWRVKLECVRLIATLKLDPERTSLIWSFVESYLHLNDAELKEYEREFAQLPQETQETTMEFITSYQKQGRIEGRQEGRQEGKATLLLNVAERRYGGVSSEVQKQINALSVAQLDRLGLDMFDFTSIRDLEAWLASPPILS